MRAHPSDIERQVRSWIAGDFDDRDRSELRNLLACRDCDDTVACERAQVDIADRFSGPLHFGTAGLRGALRAGPNGMNGATVAHATVAVAQYLREHHSPANPQAPIVVIGFDARDRSREFARIAAEVLSGYSIVALLSDIETPTPVLSFAVTHVRADAGIMVTASHNPRGDNGYKVFLGGIHAGAQLVTPADSQIHALMVHSMRNTPARDIPRGIPQQLDASVIEAYVSLTAATVPAPIHQPRTVYTAMHGVGAEIFGRVLTASGFETQKMLYPVLEQDAPDGSFPSLEFPNPEEDGSLDLAFTLARECDAELVLAHDPDADRLGVAVPYPESRHGFRRLTGNEVGVILGAWSAERARRSGREVGSLACSIVSSPQLERVAELFDFEFHWTLPGFKWISRVPRLIFGYEEALGYLVNPATVHDKDGLSAGLALLSVVSELRAEGKTLHDRQIEIDEQFGTYVSAAFSVRTSAEGIAHSMAGIRSNPPLTIAEVPVDRVDDYTLGINLPSADVVALWLTDGSRVMLRPSGTESKLKVYLDVCEERAPLAMRRSAALSRLTALEAAVRDIIA